MKTPEKPKKLIAKQQKFVDEYLIDLNATQAAIRAGYSAKTAGVIGYDLLQKTLVQEAVAKGLAAAQKRTGITLDRVLEEYAKLAFFDPRKLFDNTGKPLRITELDDVTAGAIAGLDVVNVSGDEDEIGQILKYKIADKKAALTDLMRHLGGFNDKVTVEVTDYAAPLVAARKRIEEMRSVYTA